MEVRYQRAGARPEFLRWQLLDTLCTKDACKTGFTREKFKRSLGTYIASALFLPRSFL